MNTPKARIVKTRGRPKKLALIRVGLLGGVYRIHTKIGNCWVEYRDPIDFKDHSSNMEIDLYWFKQGTYIKWSYDLMDHLMVDSKLIMALALMTYIIDLGAYELHPGDKNVYNDCINEC